MSSSSFVHDARRAFDMARDDHDKDDVVRALAVKLLPQNATLRRLYEELVSIIGEESFWAEHPRELLLARSLIINTDHRPIKERIKLLLERQACFGEHVRFTQELALAAMSEDQVLMQQATSYEGGQYAFWKKHWHVYVLEIARATEQDEANALRSPALVEFLARHASTAPRTPLNQ